VDEEDEEEEEEEEEEKSKPASLRDMRMRLDRLLAAQITQSELLNRVAAVAKKWYCWWWGWL